MSDKATSVLERFRKPEHTGENRCVPCTVVNLAIAGVLGAVVTRRRSRVAGALAVGLSAVVISLRGYLVPGTPALTKRYLPDRVLAAFDKHPLEDQRFEEVPVENDDRLEDDSATADAGRSTNESTNDEDEKPAFVEAFERQQENAVEPDRFLLEVEAVGPCEHEDDLCLTDEFAASVEREVERVRDTPRNAGTIADLLEIDPSAVSVKDREYPAIKIHTRIVKWPGDAALVADLATSRALTERTGRWLEVPLGQRLEILEALRSFHDRCPLCSGPVYLSEDTVESCCRSYEVRALNCRDCAEPLLEFDPNEIGGSETDGGIQP